LFPCGLCRLILHHQCKRTIPIQCRNFLNTNIEAADVLHKAFYGTDEQKNSFHESLGLEGRIVSLEKQLQIAVYQINNMEETLDLQSGQLTAVMDNMTLTTVQQGRIHRAAKDRVNHLLGGTHSREYKAKSKLYFANLWNGVKKKFECGNRWQDLNPKYFTQAFEYISGWEYVEN